jgi:hypothetical protein
VDSDVDLGGWMEGEMRPCEIARMGGWDGVVVLGGDAEGGGMGGLGGKAEA